MSEYPAVSITPGSASYWQTPSSTLDPRLFDENNHLHAEVRHELLRMYMYKMEKKYNAPREWSTIWVAGSGASYLWHAHRTPADLDMLVGIDYPTFRYRNPNMTGLTDNEIAWAVNHYMRRSLWMNNWMGFEITWYNNPESTDITTMNPYAAYNVTDDRWEVPPDPNPKAPDYLPDEYGDLSRTKKLVTRYESMRQGLSGYAPDSNRRQYADTIDATLQQAEALFKDIHDNRHAAFLPHGKGFSDKRNARWQAAKRSGVVPALRALVDVKNRQLSQAQLALYGTVLPSIEEMKIRALLFMQDR